MTYKNAVDVLSKNSQGQVLRFWDRLGRRERADLLAQIEGLDFAAITRMRKVLSKVGKATSTEEVEPAEILKTSMAGLVSAHGIGVKALAGGKVGALLVAGGQGSRLGFEGPKGCFPIGPVSGASLFEIHSRKILALERLHSCSIPFYVMTSRDNDSATIAFFEKNDYFGLSRERVRFFVQGMWPALDASGHVILDRAGHIFMSPDGHGGTLAALRESGMLDDMTRRKLTTIYYFQVDNPMVEIADPVFVGLHNMQKSDMSIKVCGKRHANEGLGVVVVSGGKNRIVEYTELSDEQKNAKARNGQLKYNAGSVAIHMFSLTFLRRAASLALPLHAAHKKVPVCDDKGKPVKPDAPNAYKFEKFIFDALPRAQRAMVLEFAREDEFSPVKNASGDDSPETARRDMVRKCARWLEQCGIKVPRGKNGNPKYSIEIDPCFAVNADVLRRKLSPEFKIRGDVCLR